MLTITVDVEDEISKLDLGEGVLLIPVAVWFSGSSNAYVTIEFEEG